MIPTIKIASLTLMTGFTLGLAANTVDPPSAVAGGGVIAPQVLKADTLTKQQFEQQLKRLPDNAVIEFKGQRMTKAQIRALAAQKGRANQAKGQAVARQSEVQFEQRRFQFEQQQQAKLQADNAKAMAEFTRQSQAGGPAASPQLDAIQQEAAQLFERSKRASPAEQAQIEQRAGQLLQQLQQLGR